MPGTLTHSPARIVAQMLIGMGHGTNPLAEPLGDWPVYADAEPPLPDSVITVRDTAGRDGGREHVQGERAEHHGILIRVRSSTHEGGYAKARALAVALDQDVYQESLSISGSSYRVHCVTRTGDVIVLGKQLPQNKRSLFTINALVAVRADTNVLVTELGDLLVTESGDVLIWA